MNFLEKRKEQLGIASLGDKIRAGKVKIVPDPAKYVKGPPFMDCLTHQWARGKMMGLIGASGIGKTELVLEIFHHILENNTNPNDICVFVSLEMTSNEIAERWIDRVGIDSELTDRFYVISNYLDDGKSRNMGVGDFTQEIKLLRDATGADILCTAVDHLHIINKKDTEDLNKVCHQLKDACVELDTFMIPLSQTQKENNSGDIPLDQNASHSCSQFAWISDWVLTVHAPLKKVSDKTNLNILAWQYAKIRNKAKSDKIKTSVNYLLSYDVESRRLSELTPDHQTEFVHLYADVLSLRDMEKANKYAEYNLNKKQSISSEDLRQHEDTKKETGFRK